MDTRIQSASDSSPMPQPSPSSGITSLRPLIMFAVAMVVSTTILGLVCCSMRRRRINEDLRRRRTGVGRPPGPPPGVAPARDRGLSKEVLSSIPEFVYAPDADEESGRTVCCVCLGQFEENERGRLLPVCLHRFHVECVDRWFQFHSTCPICRSAVVPGSGAASRTETGVCSGIISE